MKAFTLIEILLAIGLIAVLASVGFLSLSNFRGGEDLSLASRVIISLLRDAQSRATSGEGGQFWGVRFDAGGKRMTIFSGTACVYENSVSVSALDSNLQFVAPASGLLDICFLKNSGYLSGAADATIKIGVQGDENQTRTIIIRQNGLIE